MKRSFKHSFVLLLILINISNVFAQSDKKAEISKLQKELTILSKSTDKDLVKLADLNNKIAKLYFGLKDYKKALETFESELSIRNSMLDTGQNSVAKSKVMFNIIGLRRQNADYKNALDLALQSIKYNESKFGTISKEAADAHKQTAEIAYMWKRPAYFRKHYDLAFSIYKDLTPVDTFRLIDLIILKGSVAEFGEHDKSLAYYNEALSLYNKYKKENIDLLFRIYINIGSIYSFKGKYAEALKYAQKSLELKKNKDEISVSLALVYDRIGIYFQKFNNTDAAIKYYDLALSMAEKLLGADNPKTLEILSHKAGALYEVDSIQLAKKLFEKIVNSGNEIEKNPAYNYSLGFLAQINLKTGNKENFVSFFNKIIANRIKYFGENKNPDLAFTYHKLALHYQENNNLDLFKKYILKSLETADVFGNIPEKIDYLNILSSYLEFGDYVPDSLINIGFSLVNQAFNEANIDADKQLAIETGRNFFESLLFYESKNTEDNPQKRFSNLIKCFEGGKSILLTSNISETESMKAASLPDSIQEKYNYLKSNLNYFEKQWINAELESDSANLSFFKTEANLFRKSLDSLKGNILLKYPRFSYIVNNLQAVPDLKEIRTIIAKNEMIYNYFIGNKFSFVLAVNHENVYFKLLDSVYKKEMEVLLNQFNNPEKVQKDLKNSLEDYIHSGTILSKVLLENLPDSSKIKNLTIIPDGNLHYLPFEALLKGKTESKNQSFKSLPYIVKHHNVKYAYNLSVLKKQLEKSPDENEEGVLAVAPEYANESKEHVPLKGAVEELKMLEIKYEGKYFYEQKISKTSLIEKLNRSPEFVHLAMHAYAPDSSDAYMLLSKQKKGEDEKLWLREIMALPLEQTKMLVLSACQTGIGAYRDGEGLLSMGRGFAYSGTKSMVTTLWPLYDKAAAELMKSFYDYLDKGFDKADALRRAKLDFIEKAGAVTAHPIYWASPLIWGNTLPVNIPKASIFTGWFFLWTAIGLGSLAFLLIVISRRYQNKHNKESL